MSNALYPGGIDGLLTGLIDLDTAVVKCSLVRGYTYDSTDVFMSDVVAGGGTLNGTSAALSSVSVSGGAFDAADTAITATANGNNHALIIFQSSAVTGGSDVAQSAQRLICYMDTGTGLPIQPGSGDVAVAWPNGANKIFKFS